MCRHINVQNEKISEGSKWKYASCRESGIHTQPTSEIQIMPYLQTYDVFLQIYEVWQESS